MSTCSDHHKKLDENGVGKCSVPMWMSGLPAGFCDEPAYGKQLPYEFYNNPRTGERVRFDGGYTGYVPALACPAHGGPKQPAALVKDPAEMNDEPCPLLGYRWATPEDKHDNVMYGPTNQHGQHEYIELPFDGADEPYFKWPERNYLRPMVPVEVNDES